MNITFMMKIWSFLQNKLIFSWFACLYSMSEKIAYPNSVQELRNPNFQSLT